MENDLKLCASAFLRNKGKNVVTEKEFLMGLSFDSHWMPYSDAEKVLGNMLAAGVLERSNGYLKPTFDISEVDVPVAYRPSSDIIKPIVSDATDEQHPMGLPDLMRIAVDAGISKSRFMSASNAIQKHLDIDIAAAALIALRDFGVDISDYAEPVYKTLSEK